MGSTKEKRVLRLREQLVLVTLAVCSGWGSSSFCTRPLPQYQAICSLQCWTSWRGKLPALSKVCQCWSGTSRPLTSPSKYRLTAISSLVLGGHRYDVGVSGTPSDSSPPTPPPPPQSGAPPVTCGHSLDHHYLTLKYLTTNRPSALWSKMWELACSPQEPTFKFNWRGKSLLVTTWLYSSVFTSLIYSCMGSPPDVDCIE